MTGAFWRTRGFHPISAPAGRFKKATKVGAPCLKGGGCGLGWWGGAGVWQGLRCLRVAYGTPVPVRFPARCAPAPALAIPPDQTGHEKAPGAGALGGLVVGVGGLPVP